MIICRVNDRSTDFGSECNIDKWLNRQAQPINKIVQKPAHCRPNDK
jgi:hypothetical protein